MAEVRGVEAHPTTRTGKPRSRQEFSQRFLKIMTAFWAGNGDVSVIVEFRQGVLLSLDSKPSRSSKAGRVQFDRSSSASCLSMSASAAGGGAGWDHRSRRAKLQQYWQCPRLLDART